MYRISAKLIIYKETVGQHNAAVWIVECLVVWSAVQCKHYHSPRLLRLAGETCTVYSIQYVLYCTPPRGDRPIIGITPIDRRTTVGVQSTK